MEFASEFIRLIWAHWDILAMLEIGVAGAVVHAEEITP